MRKMILMLKAMSLATLMLIVGCGGSVYGAEGSAEPGVSASDLIILSCTPQGHSWYLGGGTYALQSLDIGTGEVTDIANFNVDANDANEVYYTLNKAFYINYRGVFSRDFDKLAVTAHFASDGSSHAGWIDKSGQFFDVTEALGLAPQSDFSDAARYSAYGFAEDGSYVFSRYDPNADFGSERVWYNIDPNNLDPSAIKDGNSFLGYGKQSYNVTDITDWIGDTHFIMDGISGNSTSIVDIETSEITAYLPDSSRVCWDGIISPDRKEIAFLSKASVTAAETSIFIVPVDGGDPVKIDSPFQFTSDSSKYELLEDHEPVILIGWQ